MAGIPFDVNVMLKYGEQIAKLKESLQKAGTIDVHLRYTNELNEFKRNLNSSAKDILITLNYNDTIMAFKKAIDGVVNNVSLKFQWENALSGVKTALNNLKLAPIEVRFEYERKLERLRSDMANAFADISIDEEMINMNPARVVEKIQEAINDPQRGLQMFNEQSRFNRAKLVRYLQRLSDEMGRISGNSNTSIELPIKAKLDESITDLEAGVIVPAVDTEKLQEIGGVVQEATQQINEALADISFNEITSGLNEVIEAFSASISGLPDTVRIAVDTVLSELERIRNFSFDVTPINDEVRASLQALVDLTANENFGENSPLISFFSRLGAAIGAYNNNPPSMEAISQLSATLNELATSFGGLATQADELMNGSFGRLLEALNNTTMPDFGGLQDAIQQILDAFTQDLGNNESLVRIITRLNVVIRVLNNLLSVSTPLSTDIAVALNTLGDRLVGVLSGVGGGDNGRGGGDNGRGGGDNGRGGGDNGRGGGDNGRGDGYDNNRRNGRQDRQQNGNGNTTGIDAVLNNLTQIRQFFRDLQQMGLEMPRWIGKTIGTVEGLITGWQKLNEWTNNLRVYTQSMAELNETLRDDTLRQLGMDAETTFQTLDGVSHNMGNIINLLGTDAEAYYHQLREEGRSTREAQEEAFRYYRENLNNLLRGEEVRDRSGYVLFNAGGVVQDRNGNNIDTRRAQQSLSGLNLSGDIGKTFTQIVSRIAPTVIQAIKQRIFAVIGRWLGKAVVRWGAIIVGVVVSVFKFIQKQFIAVHGDNVKRRMEAESTALKFITAARIRSIQQTTEIEKQNIKDVSEIERKRVENIREMQKNKFSMYSWELEIQQKLYDIELQRMQAQKQRELLNKKVQNISTNVNAQLDAQKERMEGELDWTYRGGFWRTLINQETIVDKYGNYKDTGGISDFAFWKAWNPFSGSSGWWTGMGTEDYIKAIQENGKMLAEVNHEWFNKMVQPIVEKNQSILSELTELQVSGMLTSDEEQYIEDLIEAIQKNTDALAKAEKDATYAHVFGDFNSVEEMLYGKKDENGNDLQPVARYDENLGIIYASIDGEVVVLGKGKTIEDALKSSKGGLFRSDKYKEEFDIRRAQALGKRENLEELRKKAELASAPEERARIQKIQEDKLRRDKALEYSEQLLNQEKEFKNKITEEFVKMTSSQANWKESNETKRATQEAITRRIRHMAELNDPRLIGNKEAETYLRAYQDWEESKLSAKNELIAEQAWDKWNKHTIERDRAKFDLEQSQITARHKLEMENIQAVAKVQIDNINLQRDLIKRMLDHAVNQFKIMNDPYGRNKYDTMKELGIIQIERGFDKRITEIKKLNNEANQQWEKEQKAVIQEKVERQENVDFEERWNLEEKLLEEKQRLEMELLEKEFELRLKQIMIEVKYRHDLEEQYDRMREANTENWLSTLDKQGGMFSEEEILNSGYKLEKYKNDMGKIVLTDKDRMNITNEILNGGDETKQYRDRIAEFRQTTNSEGYKKLESYMKERGIEVDKELDEWFQSKLNSTEEKFKGLQKLLDDDKKVKEGAGEFRDVADITRLEALRHEGMLAIAKKHNSQTERDAKLKEKNDAIQKQIDELNEKKRELLGADAEKISNFVGGLLDTAQDSLVTTSGLNAIGGYLETAGGTMLAGAGVTAATGVGTVPAVPLAIAGGVTTVVGGLVDVLADAIYNHQTMGDDIKDKFMAQFKDSGLTKEEMEQLWSVYVERIEQRRKERYEGEDWHDKYSEEQIKADNADIAKGIGAMAVDMLLSHAEGGNKAIYDINKQIAELTGEMGVNTLDSANYDELIKQLELYGDSETQAILAQTDMAVRNAHIEHKYLDEIASALKSSGLEDVKKELALVDLHNQKSLEQQKQTAERRLEKIRTEAQSQFDIAKAQREDLQKGQLDSLEAQKEINKSVLETAMENQKRQDQFNADIVKREADYRQAQRGTNTDFALSMMGAKTGTDRLKAIAKYNADTEYNAETTAMEERHRAETEALMRRGNFTEEEKAQLEARQQDEKSILEESKKFSDGVRDAMGEVGGIRSLITEGTGQTADLVGTWERIQAAAFGHVEDPAADAVINMDRAQALQHAALMSLLTQQLPSIAQGINRISYPNIVNNYNNAINSAPTVRGWS